MNKVEMDVTYSYSEQDSMLYAMAIGMGRDPLNSMELDFVYERLGRLRVVPTQSITVARHNLIYDIGLDLDRLLHCEQTVRIHNPLPVRGSLVANQRVMSVTDKGKERGILIETESSVRLADSNTPLFDLRDLFFAKGDGGVGSFGKINKSTVDMPNREPDIVCFTESEPWQALLYRTAVGDRSGIHAELGIAQRAGFDRPILHGSCTLAIACREVLINVCNYDVNRFGSFAACYTAVAYPGERFETHIWVTDDIVQFRCNVPARHSTVLDCGYVRLVPSRI